jgi:hypothetical protein
MSQSKQNTPRSMTPVNGKPRASRPLLCNPKQFNKLFYVTVNNRINFVSNISKRAFWKHWVCKYFIDDNPALKQKLENRMKTTSPRERYKTERHIVVEEIDRLYARNQTEDTEKLINKFSTVYKRKFFEREKAKVFSDKSDWHEIFFSNVNNRSNFTSIKERDSYWKQYAFKFFIDDNPKLKQELENIFIELEYNCDRYEVEKRLAMDELNRLHAAKKNIDLLVDKFSTEYVIKFREQYKAVSGSPKVTW